MDWESGRFFLYLWGCGKMAEIRSVVNADTAKVGNRSPSVSKNSPFARNLYRYGKPDQAYEQILD